MKVNMYILEVSFLEYDKLTHDTNKFSELLTNVGSRPRLPLSIVENMIVPPEKVWLFPIDSDFKRLEEIISGERIVKSVKI